MTSRKPSLPLIISYVDPREEASFKWSLQYSIDTSPRLPKKKKHEKHCLIHKQEKAFCDVSIPNSFFSSVGSEKIESIITSLKYKSSNISTYSTKVIISIKSLLSRKLSNILLNYLQFRFFPNFEKLHTPYQFPSPKIKLTLAIINLYRFIKFWFDVLIK